MKKPICKTGFLFYKAECVCAYWAGYCIASHIVCLHVSAICNLVNAQSRTKPNRIKTRSFQRATSEVEANRKGFCL